MRFLRMSDSSKKLRGRTVAMPEGVKSNLHIPGTPSRKVRNTGLPPTLGQVDDGVLRNLIESFRAVIFIDGVPRGGRTAAVKQVARDLGKKVRSVWYLLAKFRAHGLDGLVRKQRADCGRPRSLSPDVFRLICERRKSIQNVKREWERLGSPATYESFRFWVRFVQRRNVIELPNRQGEGCAASF